ncbi:MAG: PEP-CTERM sorting domain-containing protein [Planctomycetaceae bacterium]
MNRHYAAGLAVAAVLMGIAPAAWGQTVLFSENFDVDSTASWTVNSFVGGTTASGGSAANAANFFFDYSTVGIPAAPNTTGGSTRGLKLQANISGTGPTAGLPPGISVSPTGQSFTGDYSLRFDWWTNFIGNTTGGIGNTSGGSGSTQLSTFGILTSGTVANYAGSCDGVFYGATPDGASASDYRAYSVTAQSGYTTGTTGVNFQNVYAAGSQQNTNAYYATPFPGGKTAPLIQQTSYALTQTGTTVVGTPSFTWNDVLIEKNGATITWTVNGTLLATTSTSGFATATKGNNILFGQADTSVGAGTPAATFQAVDFTLIDNVRVLSAVPEPTTLALVAGAAAGALPLVIRWRRRRA